MCVSIEVSRRAPLTAVRRRWRLLQPRAPVALEEDGDAGARADADGVAGAAGERVILVDVEDARRGRAQALLRRAGDLQGGGWRVASWAWRVARGGWRVAGWAWRVGRVAWRVGRNEDRTKRVVYA